jgi:hypothetical protein
MALHDRVDLPWMQDALPESLCEWVTVTPYVAWVTINDGETT